MIQRRVTVFYKLSIFWTAVRLSDNLNVRAAKYRSDAEHQESRQKRKIHRTVALFCKLSIFCLVMVFSEMFTVGAPKTRSDDKHHKTS